MSVIDVDSLLQEVSADTAAGEDLEYDPEFGELERLAEGKPEQQMGDTVVPAEEPDWKAVRKTALSLLGRTKDMRISMHLLRALVHTDGIVGLHDGLALFRGLLERYWHGIHPQLDPEDGNDPTMRVNVLASMCDDDSFLRPVREAPLVSSRALGRFSLRDIAVAKGEIPPGADETPPTMAVIDGAFREADPQELQATAEAVREAMEHVTALEAFVTEQVGAANAQNLNALVKVLKEAERTLLERLADRGIGSGAETEAEEGGEVPERGAPGRAGAPISGEINTRDDVVRMLDKILAYYRRQEPSSPVPILMERAKRLVHMDFMDIMQNLAPDGVPQIEVIRGPEPEAAE